MANPENQQISDKISLCCEGWYLWSIAKSPKVERSDFFKAKLHDASFIECTASAIPSGTASAISLADTSSM
jgi:hypothetical protein